MASHNARIKQTVEKERSPPESDRMSLAPSPSVVVGCTYKGRGKNVLLSTTAITQKLFLCYLYSYKQKHQMKRIESDICPS